MQLTLATLLAILGLTAASPVKPQNILGALTGENPVDALELLPGQAPATEALFPWPHWPRPLVDTEKLQQKISTDALQDRAETLFNISQRSIDKYGNPTRVIGSPGHWGTVDYILSEMRLLSRYYDVDVQKFEALEGHVNSFSLLIDGVQPKLLLALAYTPATPKEKPVHGHLVLVDNFGCNAEDFPSKLTAGNIALVKRGNCTFGSKLIQAGKAGAVGLVIYDDEPVSGTLGSATGDEVPTVSISSKDAAHYIKKLTANPHHKFETTLFVDAYLKKIKTLNVIAETKGGDHDNVVCLGAHSDSVADGPGINDDGSGTISLLEVARQLTDFKVHNAVRFAWWAGEEEGLLGSYAYANALLPEENAKIRLFMDYDMMASPNYEYQIYNGTNEDFPAGSGSLRDLYIDYYEDHGLNWTLVPFDGRSDYVGFLDQGIPAGGIATGAEGVKTPEGQEKFGGEAGKWFDPCYHQLCDSLANVDYDAWLVNTQLIAHSVATYARDLENFPVRSTVKTASTTKPSDDFKYRGSYLVM